MANQRTIEATERQAKALQLRKRGLGFEAIARELGYKDASGAFRAVSTALKKTLREPAEELRTLETERLDAMLVALWPSVLMGDTDSVEKALKVMDRRAKLLGLDAPTRVAPTNPEGDKEYGAGLTDDDRASRVASLLDSLRTRGLGSPARTEATVDTPTGTAD